MGQYHVLAISEDAINLSSDRRNELREAIGDAVISLCVGDPLVNMSGPEPALVRSRGVLNAGAGVHWAGDVHHTETSIFVWSQRKLRPWYELPLDELEEVAKMVDQTIADRKNS